LGLTVLIAQKAISRSRFTSDIEALPHLLRHLTNVALHTTYLRSRSATGTPASDFFRIPTIWDSLNDESAA
jgi:hypothetical protein